MKKGHTKLLFSIALICLFLTVFFAYDTNVDLTFTNYLIENPVKLLQILLLLILFTSFIIAIMIALFQRNNKNKLISDLNIDKLTGLSTQYHFEVELKRYLTENPLCNYTIFSFDLDNFKYVNEIYGHATGSKLLQEIGEYLKKSMPDALLIARQTADQFLIFLETEHIFTDILISEKPELIANFLNSEHCLGSDYNFSFSIGFHHIIDKSQDVNYLVNCARLARDLGKNINGYTINEFTPEMALKRAKNNEIVAKMKTSIKNKDFIMYYQPKVDLKTEKIVGAEALVRWIHEGKMIPPNDFIPVFEKNGFIVTLDYYVLDEVCNFLSKYSDKKLPVISVNLSAVTIMKDDLLDKISSSISNSKVPPKMLDFEITESAIVDNFDSAIKKIHILKDLGFTIAIDDFGVGISSLSRLKSIPIDTLKIDRLFVIDAIENQKDSMIVTAIINLAKSLKMKTVVEGIENIEQKEFFEKLDCDIAQGYYYSRPLTETDFLQYLEQN
ncbi:MAG: bifunctional diguanylate cyclase/phosphodiesterase [Clostridia bacterium]